MRFTNLFALLLMAASFSFAQLADDFAPPGRGNCCLVSAAQNLTNQLMDWDQFARYHAENVKLRAQPAEAQRVVFMGDSITDFWKLAQSFPGKPYVNRGISGQVTGQMLARMFQDVIDLKPAVVTIFGGTNDVARNNGPETFEMVTENLQAMTELAQLHGIRVVLCSIMPVADYGPRRMSDGRPPADIVKLNTWIREYAAKVKAGFADYYGATVDEKGMLKEGMSRDGLHPNDQGYALMAPVITAAIQQALAR